MCKDKLSKQHYEGLYPLNKINSQNNKQIEIIHGKDLEDDALAVIQKWEQNLKKI